METHHEPLNSNLMTINVESTSTIRCVSESTDTSAPYTVYSIRKQPTHPILGICLPLRGWCNAAFWAFLSPSLPKFMPAFAVFAQDGQRVAREAAARGGHGLYGLGQAAREERARAR